MSGQIFEIAERIRAMREICDFSQEEIADRMEMSLQEYKETEAGNVDIPISFLTRIAPILGVEVTALLTGKSPKLQAYSLCRKGKGTEVRRNNRDYAYHSLAYNFRNKTVEPFEVTILPDDPDAEVDLDTHEGQEFDYVLEGIMKFCIGGREIIMTEGDSIYLDSRMPHGMKAINGKVRFMAIVIPPIDDLLKNFQE